MSELAFWEMLFVLSLPLVGVWQAYKLGQKTIRWMTLPQLATSGVFISGGAVFPSAILWVTAGALWALLLYFVVSFIEGAVCALEKGRHERRVAQQIRLDRQLMEEH